MKTNSKRWIAITTRSVIAVVIIVVSLMIYQTLVHSAPVVVASDAPTNMRRVQVYVPQAMPVRRQWRGYGTAQPLDAANVPARVTATVINIADDIQAGTKVTQGQTLVQLDPSDFEFQRDISRQAASQTQAEIELLKIEREKLEQRTKLSQEDWEIAQRDYNRSRELADRGAATPNQVDRDRRAVIAADLVRIRTAEDLEKLTPRLKQLAALLAGQQAQLRQAQTNLDRTKIQSPIDGYLQHVDVEVGESVTAGQVIARVVDISNMEVPVQLPAAARADIALGDSITLTTVNREDLTWNASIKRMAPEDDSQSRTVTVFVEASQKQAADQFGLHTDAPLLLPGMFVSAVAESSIEKQHWMVPRRSVRDGRVLTFDGQIIMSQKVDVAFSVQGVRTQSGLDDDQWLVLSGPMEQGIPIVVNATPSIIDGQSIEPVLIEAAANDQTAEGDS